MEETLKTNARAVLDVLRASEKHPTALEVYEEVRRVRPRIGLATVYRILHQLTAQGLIQPSVRPRPSGLGICALVLVWGLGWVLDNL